MMCGLITNKLNIVIHTSDICTYHRLGKQPISRGLDRRNLIVKLWRGDLKKNLMSASRELRPNIFISETLAPLRDTILYFPREKKGVVQWRAARLGKV